MIITAQLYAICMITAAESYKTRGGTDVGYLEVVGWKVEGGSGVELLSVLSSDSRVMKPAKIGSTTRHFNMATLLYHPRQSAMMLSLHHPPHKRAFVHTIQSVQSLIQSWHIRSSVERSVVMEKIRFPWR